MSQNLIRKLREYRVKTYDLPSLPPSICTFAAARLSPRIIDKLESCLEIYVPPGSKYSIHLCPDGFFDIWVEKGSIKNIFITENRILLDGKVR